MSIKIVRKSFAVSAGHGPFLAYLDGVKFGAWRPRFVTTHHTGSPNLADWNKWQARKVPVTDDQWMQNLADYYGSAPPKGPAGGPWQHGPHFFFTPAHWCVFSPPEVRGTHAVSFNGLSWGVEMVGDFDTEPFAGELRRSYVTGLACLHLATGLKVAPYQYATQGLHFHRDDPTTRKSCPGEHVLKDPLSVEVVARIVELSGGEAPHDEITEVKKAPATQRGVVTGVAVNDTLNVRAQATGKAPVVLKLRPGEEVVVTGRAKNGTTEWLSVDIPGDEDGWVAARYVRLK